MALRDELDTFVADTFKSTWTTRQGQKVPESDDLKISNDAVTLEGTVLYADLAESTQMVKGYKDWFAAEVYKNYLYCSARLIRYFGGTITSYDGDRVMGVFIGDSKNSNAAKCGLKINYTVRELIQSALKERYSTTDFVLKQKVGIDTSALFVAKTGIRGNNDLVWVGRAANNAAKMAALSTSYSTYISADVYSNLNEASKYSKGTNMWTNLGSQAIGSQIYGSTYQWSF